MPSPGVSTTLLGIASSRPLLRASSTMVCAMMCLEAWSSEAASRRISSADTSATTSVATICARPCVNVPVLSITSARTRAKISSAWPPLTRMPCLAARDRPETIATGTARMSGQGVATTSTATARMGSALQSQDAPASAMVAARNTIADLLLDGDGFAGQGRLIENGQAFYDRPIDRDHVAFSNHEAIARLDHVQVDLLEPAVAVADRRVRYPGKQRRRLPACATLGKCLEVLPAGIHQSDHDGGEVFGKDQRRQHRQGGHDIQPDIAAAQADDDLRHEREQDRNRSGGPYRGSPMRPSGQLRREPDDQADRGPCDDHRSKKAPNTCPRPRSVHRS